MMEELKNEEIQQSEAVDTEAPLALVLNGELMIQRMYQYLY